MPFVDGFESGDICDWSTSVGWGGPQCPIGPVESREVVTYDSAGRLYSLSPTGGDPKFIFYFAGRPVATYTGGPMPSYRLLSTDHLGTPALAFGLDGLSQWVGGFEPFGRDFTIPSAASQGIFLRLPGQWNDGLWNDGSLGTELYYNVHRFYEQQTARYGRYDPIGLLPPERNSLNPYRYAQANPLGFFDALGLDSNTDDSGVQDCMFCIFFKAGYGFSNTEEGFWLTCDGGKLGCQIWPATARQGNSSRSSTSSSPRPPNACGIFHTHPRQKPGEPSSCEGCDVSVSEDSGLPIYVVHPSGLWKYDPNSDKVTQEGGPDWSKGPKKRCKKPCEGLNGNN